MITPATKTCNTCSVEKPVSEFDELGSKRCTLCRKARARAYAKAYRESPEGRAKIRAHENTPERQAKKRGYYNNPERKSKMKAYRESPEGKAVRKAYRESPEGRAKKKAWNSDPLNKARANGLRSTPKRKAKILEYNNRPVIKSSRRINKLKDRYGINEEQEIAMLEEQGHKCKACRISFDGTTKRCVDHDHATGDVRGILCDSCNLMLGRANDQVHILEGLIDYLESPPAIPAADLAYPEVLNKMTKKSI